MDGESRANAVRATKGVHIAVPRERLATHAALTLLSPTDGRVMFALPSTATTIMGTTDTPTDERPERVRASRQDIDYLLAAANFFFPAARLTPADVVAAWAGIRPLVASGFTRDPASASREHRIDRSASGMISVSGGKLTTYRSMAAEVVDVVERSLGRRRRRAKTNRRAVAGWRYSLVRRSAARRRAGGGRFGRCAAARGSTRLPVARGGCAHDGGARARTPHRARSSLPAGGGRVRGRARDGDDARGCPGQAPAPRVRGRRPRAIGRSRRNRGSGRPTGLGQHARSIESSPGTRERSSGSSEHLIKHTSPRLSAEGSCGSRRDLSATGARHPGGWSPARRCEADESSRGA